MGRIVSESLKGPRFEISPRGKVHLGDINDSSSVSMNSEVLGQVTTGSQANLRGKEWSRGHKGLQ